MPEETLEQFKAKARALAEQVRDTDADAQGDHGRWQVLRESAKQVLEAADAIQ